MVGLGTATGEAIKADTTPMAFGGAYALKRKETAVGWLLDIAQQLAYLSERLEEPT